MNDTTQNFNDFQYMLIMKMTPQQRFRMGLEMADEGMKLMKAGILSERGKLTEAELRMEVIRRLRQYDPTLSWLDESYPEVMRALFTNESPLHTRQQPLP